MFASVIVGVLLTLGLLLSGGPVKLNPLDKRAVLPLRGILVLLVVSGHLFAELGLGNYSLARSAVAVFFFLSGYGLMKKRMSGGGVILEGGFSHAAIKLLPKFFIASGAYMIVMAVCGHELHLWRNILAGSSSLPIPFTWYIPAIMALYGIFYSADRFCRTDKVLIICIALGIVAYWLMTASVFKWPFYWWKSVGGFVAGVIFAVHEGMIRDVMVKHIRIVYHFLIVLLVGVVVLQSQSVFSVHFLADHAFQTLLGPCVALILLRFDFIPAVFALLGKISYEVYVVHGAFVFLLRQIVTNDACYFGAVLVCSVCAGAALSRVRISPRLFKSGGER